MKGNCFIDTNILIYAHTDRDPHKQSVAQKLLKSEGIFVSTHVLMELTNVLSKRLIKDWKIVAKIVKETSDYYNIHTVNSTTIELSLSLAPKYKYSFYDSLIIASAIESDCKTLFSEDLQHNQKIEDSLMIVNPFKQD
jgi:predicted nucleic acid-binding protein